MSSVEIAGLAVLAVPVLLRALLRLVKSRDSLSTRIFVVTSIFGGVLFQSTLLPESALPQLLIVVIAACVALQRRRISVPGSVFDRSPSVRAWILVALWAFLFAVNLIDNAGLSDAAVFGRLVPGGYWILIVLVVGGTRITIDSVTTALQLSLAAVTIAAIAVGEEATRPCDLFKCGGFGSIYRGAYISENYLGIVCAFTMVATVGSLHPRERVLGSSVFVYLLGFGILFASSSRTSAIGAACGIVAALVARRARRRRVVQPDGSLPRPFGAPTRLYMSAMPWIAGLISLLLVYRAAGNSFSNRGAVWQQARRLLEGHELVGLGIGRWEGYAGVSQVSHHFAHSTFLLAYFSGGLVALVGLLFFVTVANRHCLKFGREGTFMVGYMTAFLTISLTEVVFNPMTVDGLTWTVIPFLVGGLLPSSNGEVDPAQVQSAIPRSSVARPQR